MSGENSKVTAECIRVDAMNTRASHVTELTLNHMSWSSSIWPEFMHGNNLYDVNETRYIFKLGGGLVIALTHFIL